MAVQTVPISVNVDNVMTPWFVGVSRSAAATAFGSAPMPATTGAVVVITDRVAPGLMNWNGVAYGNEIFLTVSSSTGATGASNLAASSIDGITWAYRTMSISASWGAVAFGNGKFVAVVDGSTTVTTTTDGFNWNTQALQESGYYRSIHYGDNKFIALAWNSSIAQISSDGSLWATAALPAVRNWSSLAYDSCIGRWVAVASNTNKGAYSDDGSTWTEMTMTKDTSWNSVASNNRRQFVAVSNSADTSALAYSTDGINWSYCKGITDAMRWKSVCYGENYDPLYQARWYTVSHSTRNWSSDNGINWTRCATTNAKEYTQVISAYIPWRTNDTLTINNGAVVTVNTDQKKFWSAMTLTNGVLNIVNDSSTVAIRFKTGRTSGAAAQAITPASGLGNIIVTGNFIDLSVGTGLLNQQITTPYSDYISALWVETAADSSIFEIWLNVTGAYGGTIPRWLEGLDSVGSGQRGKFFIQIPNSIQNKVYGFIDASVQLASRTVKLSSTEGIYPGAQIIGRNAVTGALNMGIPANSVVEKIIDGSLLDINLVCTLPTTKVDASVYNPYVEQLSNVVQFGNGINGNVVPAGARVRIPNIMLTSDTPANLQTASGTLGMSFVMTAGGNATLDTCLIDEAYHNFTQAQTLTLKNVGNWNPFILTECYNVDVSSFGMGLPPIRRFYGSTGWIQRDIRDAYTQLILTGSYLINAKFYNIAFVANTLGFTGGSTTVLTGMLNLSYASGITGNNFRFYKLQNIIAGHLGMVMTNISNSNFTNIETYGMMPFALSLSSNNTFNNLTYSSDMFNQSMGYTAAQRLGYDPITDEELVDNTPYYFKVRNFFTRDRLVYKDSEEFSTTPFLGSKYFPDYLTCYCNASKSVTLVWPQRVPIAATPSYEIYRGASADFTRNASSLIFSTNTAATLTFVNSITKPVITAAAAKTLTFDGSTTGIGRILMSGGASQSFLDGSISVNDTLIVTGTNLNNRNYTVKTIDTSLILTTNEPIYTEPAYTGTATFTVVHALNHQPIVATATKTLTFAVGKTITAGGTETTFSFLQQGYVVGDVVEISGCTDPINNGVKTISVLTPTVMTVLEPLASEATYTADATITGKSIENNTTYYYVFRKYDSSIAGVLTYSDSAPQEVYVHDPNQISTNRLLQNDVFGNAAWVKTNSAITSDVVVGPMQNPTTGIGTADLLIPTVAGGSISQTFGAAINASYNFSVFVATMPYDTITTTRGTIMLSGTANASTNFIADASFSRVNISLLADVSVLTARIIVTDVSGRLLLSGAMANLGETPDPPITTTTVPVTNVNSTRYPTLVRSWCREWGDEPRNSGIEFTYAAAPTGTLLTEVYCSSTRGFIPSIRNKVYNIYAQTDVQNIAILNIYNGSSNNYIKNLTQLNKAFNATYGVLFNTLCSNNTVKDVSVYLNYSAMTNLFYPAAGSNDNFVHNWNIGGYRNYASVAPIYADNKAKGFVAQNIKMTNSDFPIKNLILNTKFKGVSGGNAAPAVGSLMYSLGSTVDGVNIAAGAVYDTIFNELYFSASTGALHVMFNASQDVAKPYTLFGSASFANSGKLFLKNASDGIEYIWPHTILGISGFRAVPRTYLQDGIISTIQDMYKLSGLDLGTTTDLLEGLKVEYDLDKGPGYTGYRRCISSNMLSEVVSASTGFGLKLKLTAAPFMKYGAKVNSFVPGETIKGLTSQATATVGEVYEVSTGSLLGTIWISDVSGTFIAGEIVRTSLDVSRGTNVATNTFTFGPSFTSYIDGLQLFTYNNQSVLYPSEIITLTMTVKDESNNPIVGAYAFIDDAAITAPFIMNTTTNALGVASVSYSGGTSAGSTWRVRKYGYKPYSQTVDIGSVNISLPVTLITDPQQV